MAYLITQDTKRNIKVKKTTVTQLEQMVDHVYTAINGGTIEYAPAPNSTYVYYEFNSMISYGTDLASYGKFRLVYGPDTNNLTSIATDDVNYIAHFGGTNTNTTRKQKDTVPIKLVFIIPAWQGTKYLVLQGLDDSEGAGDYYINGIRAEAKYPEEDDADDLFDPFVIVYSY